MKIDANSININMARSCLSLSELSEISGLKISTIQGALKRCSARPATVGKIARALGVDVENIIEK